MRDAIRWFKCKLKPPKNPGLPAETDTIHQISVYMVQNSSQCGLRVETSSITSINTQNTPHLNPCYVELHQAKKARNN